MITDDNFTVSRRAINPLFDLNHPQTKTAGPANSQSHSRATPEPTARHFTKYAGQPKQNSKVAPKDAIKEISQRFQSASLSNENRVTEGVANVTSHSRQSQAVHT
ncbi:hypothetical protein ACFPTX_01790 [Pseudomonas sp. GCM10022188]|uniref:hypothetical protein n=1 Tax=Pseudomonas TaxID=286 RepID=UPI001E2B89CA|nr:hypothetical protein [Pseudomonas oryzagri]MCC6075335.1 hypothetical protein [Pseudomonas oryzagri]